VHKFNFSSAYTLSSQPLLKQMDQITKINLDLLRNLLAVRQPTQGSRTAWETSLTASISLSMKKTMVFS